MSAIATVLAAMGHQVTGSDLKWSPAMERLRAAGARLWVGHEAGQVGEAEVLAISSAVTESNPEVAEGRRRGLPVLSRAEMLAAVCELRRCIAVSGTHGKTTTTSMLSLVLVEAGMRPSFLIGGDVNEIGTNAVWDGGEWMVVEADESDGTFLQLRPEIAVVTNVEADHLDHYGSFEALVAAFDRFCTGPAAVVAGADDRWAAEVGARHGAVLVGAAAGAAYRLQDVVPAAPGVSFSLHHEGRDLGRLALPVSGGRIAQNAAVATVAAMAAGAPFEAAAGALARFAGVARRYEPRGEAAGVRFVDDYAHLPTEVRAVLESAVAEGRRLVVVFQPHRYSRTAALGEQFADAFAGASVVVVTDVFAAGEAPMPGVTGRLVADAVGRAHPELDVRYVAGREELRREVAAILRPGDLCLTLGAGDLTTLPDELMAAPAW
ncbi:MAG: UDP-N-acetylmuramate--L-alanine ligase [Acidobacteriota bacterium]|nr:UDP-N-acetylmuramate--L-alanine ligase [Acidobacteriota bacterium]